MLYEFAITPDVFDGNRLELPWLLQGLYENGLIADLHGSQWRRHTIQRLMQGCPPAVRDKVLTYLRTLNDRNRLIPYPRSTNDPTDDIEWFNLSLSEHAQRSFHAIVLGPDLFGACTPADPACIDLSMLVYSSKWQDRPQSVDVVKNEASYRAQLGPLLRHTRMLRIVDPYMRCDKHSCMTTIRICAELLGRGSHETVQRRIQIHTSPPSDNQGGFVPNLPEWEAALRPIVARYHHSIKVFLWSTSAPEYRFHDRFLLTDQCGIGSQDSFECVAQQPSTTRWFLLDFDTRQRQNAALRPETSHYRLHGHHEVV